MLHSCRKFLGDHGPHRIPPPWPKLSQKIFKPLKIIFLSTTPLSNPPFSIINPFLYHSFHPIPHYYLLYSFTTTVQPHNVFSSLFKLFPILVPQGFFLPFLFWFLKVYSSLFQVIASKLLYPLSSILVQNSFCGRISCRYTKVQFVFGEGVFCWSAI